MPSVHTVRCMSLLSGDAVIIFRHRVRQSLGSLICPARHTLPGAREWLPHVHTHARGLRLSADPAITLENQDGGALSATFNFPSLTKFSAAWQFPVPGAPQPPPSQSARARHHSQSLAQSAAHEAPHVAYKPPSCRGRLGPRGGGGHPNLKW